jgi:hypothetical protein
LSVLAPMTAPICAISTSVNTINAYIRRVEPVRNFREIG